MLTQASCGPQVPGGARILALVLNRKGSQLLVVSNDRVIRLYDLPERPVVAGGPLDAPAVHALLASAKVCFHEFSAIPALTSLTHAFAFPSCSLSSPMMPKNEFGWRRSGAQLQLVPMLQLHDVHIVQCAGSCGVATWSRPSACNVRWCIVRTGQLQLDAHRCNSYFIVSSTALRASTGNVAFIVQPRSD